MIEESFEVKLTQGDLIFDISGTFRIKMNEEIDITYDTVLVKVYHEMVLIEVDATPILNSLDAWGVLEENLTEKIKSLNNTDLILDDNNINEIDIIDENSVLGDY